MKIGFYDSGLGGTTVLNEALKNIKADYYYFADLLNSPYGTKTHEMVKEYAKNAIKILKNQGCKVIVVACNTATSVAIKDLREENKDLVIIGTEPAVKVAHDKNVNKDKKIIVTATSLTLKEEKLIKLIKRLDMKDQVILHPLDKLVYFAESKDEIDYKNALEYLKEEFLEYNFDEIESVVLGCTHFPLFKEEFKKVFGGKVNIYDGSVGIIKNLKSHIGDSCDKSTKITLISSKDDGKILNKFKKITSCNEVNFKVI